MALLATDRHSIPSSYAPYNVKGVYHIHPPKASILSNRFPGYCGSGLISSLLKKILRMKWA
jgi:hypothetical protein